MADDRADLVKRLFPVAISVGFATPVARWILIAGPTPSWPQVFSLVTAMIFVLQTWDWYHQDAGRYPLIKAPVRFYLDVIIVFECMALLLVASAGGTAWLLWLYAIMLSWLPWYLLTGILEGLLDKSARIDEAPRKDAQKMFLVDLGWSFYFLALWWLTAYWPSNIHYAWLQPYIACGVAVIGTILNYDARITEWSWLVRGLGIATIVAFAFWTMWAHCF